MTDMHKVQTRFRFGWLTFLPLMLAIQGCGEKMVAVSIMGYNHTADRSIFTFSVNGAGGHNLSPGGGGGSFNCCVSLPEHWHPGLKATVAWQYDTEQKDPNPPPPSQSVEIDVPEYKHVGDFQVHFYGNHKIKVVVSRCGLGHPFHPMSLQDQLPWAPEYTKEQAIESYKKMGESIEC